MGAHEAFERAAKFRRHNVASLESMRALGGDADMRRAAARAARDQLEQQFERDRVELDEAAGGHWHAPRTEAERS